MEWGRLSKLSRNFSCATPGHTLVRRLLGGLFMSAADRSRASSTFWVFAILAPVLPASFACSDGASSSSPPPVEAAVPVDVAGVRFAPGDVSILYPLVNPGSPDDLALRPTDSGKHGELIPKAVLAALPPLVKGQRRDDALRAVGVRIDDCFGPDAASCEQQVRIVFQPVVADGASPTTEDAAIHAFYTLDASSFRLLVRQLGSVYKKYGALAPEGGRLGVHAKLAAEPGGAFARDLRSTFLAAIGSSRLTRVTFFTRTNARAGEWEFGAFDVSGGQRTAPRQIATLDIERQRVSHSEFIDDEFSPSFTPTPVHEDSAAKLTTSGADREGAFVGALRTQNPDRHHAESIDCVSCHMASSARLYAEKALSLSAVGRPDVFQSSFDLSVDSAVLAVPANLHAFSYRFTKPSVTHRTVNESAAVAARINRDILTE